MAGEVTGCGLFGDTPDGPAECSFAGYARVPLSNPMTDGAVLRWPVCEFTVQQPGGLPPAGWALFDSDGLMMKVHRRQMGRMRRRTRWYIEPSLLVKVSAASTDA